MPVVEHELVHAVEIALELDDLFPPGVRAGRAQGGQGKDNRAAGKQGVARQPPGRPETG